MTSGNIYQQGRKLLEEEGLVSFLNISQKWIRKKLISFVQADYHGVNVMDEDWDNLIILDACRYDVFSRLVDIPGELAKCQSKGETTSRFIRQNFQNNEFYDTVYISSNAYVGHLSDQVSVYKLKGIWGDDDLKDGWDRNREVVHPEEMVKQTLEFHDEHKDKRLIAHFLQPHCPYLVMNGEYLPKGSKFRDLEGAARGEISSGTMRKVYEENVEYVLTYVNDLVDQLDGKTIITSDHGELLGENVPLLYSFLHPKFNFLDRHLYRYGHWDYLRHPSLVTVPWFEVKDDSPRRKIVNEGESAGAEINKDRIQRQLELLGYK